jgi:TPR repeat protein
MKCRFCKWLCDWLCGPELSSGQLWDQARGWEQDHSNEWDLWVADEEGVSELNDRANEVFETDQTLAFEMRKELADKGSVWAMRQIGRQYHFGQGVEVDLAQAEHYYYQAERAGSWMATLQLAKLLFDHRINEKWVGILENGVESDFIPASFWLGWYRYRRSPRRRTAQEVRSLIENAAKAGHPGARMILSRWKGQGKFGFHEMRQGFREMRSLLSDFHAGRLREYAHAADEARA